MMLTGEQTSAVAARGADVYVSAGPGSGKTTVLAARVAYLIEERGIRPDQICVLTFTRAACAEIRTRILVQVGSVAEDLMIETFHAAAFLGLGGALEVASEAEVWAAIESLYAGPMRRPPRDVPKVSELQTVITHYEASGGWWRGHGLHAVRLVHARLGDAGLMPTWDLVPRLLRVGVGRTYEHVLIDEAHDCTPGERAMVARYHGATYAVGDPRQAIMGWRGAEPGCWGAPTHWLARSHRFGAAIAGAANALQVGPAIEGRDLEDHEDAVERIPLEDILGLELLPGGAAILCRTHRDCDAVARMSPRYAHVVRDPLDPLASTADRIRDVETAGCVPVLTVHAAKGREWDTIAVVGASTIRWGHAADDPEEMRVLYVAMTRARRRLILLGGIPRDACWRARHDGLART